MSKKPDLRTPFDSQHAKKVQKLLKSARQLFYQTFQSIFKRLNWKMSLLVICEILGLLVDTLISILFVIRRIYCNQFKCNYLRNKMFFLNFLQHFSNLHQILNILKYLIAYVFLKLPIAKDVVR